ncbi:MAG: DUF5677 domain-containing protein [Acidimicrobiales bacterium]|nr:DUF5677 domain-containing protein [Acidimicrobiales bacterium]
MRYWKQPSALGAQAVNAFDDPKVAQAIEDAIERRIEDGMSWQVAADEVTDLIANHVADSIESSGRNIRLDALRRAPRKLREHRRYRGRFEANLEWVWGDALDALYLVLIVCRELNVDLFTNHSEERAEDDKLQTLSSITSRACLVTSDIHALLRTGHPLGAFARWRTLHELVVVSALISNSDQEIAQRFAAHSTAEAYKDALLHERHRGFNGRAALPDPELEALREAYEEACRRYGSRFADPWQWAAPLTEPERPTFSLLEKLAGMSHMRPDFRTASHHLHGGASGTDLINVPFRGVLTTLSGPTNSGLAEPGSGAALALTQVTLGFVGYVVDTQKPDPAVVSTMHALSSMYGDVKEAFAQADRHLASLENSFQASEARGRLAVWCHEARSRTARLKWRVGRRSGRWSVWKKAL